MATSLGSVWYGGMRHCEEHKADYNYLETTTQKFPKIIKQREKMKLYKILNIAFDILEDIYKLLTVHIETVPLNVEPATIARR
jgi:hypothetical protein